MSTLKRELLCFAVCFVFPCLALLAISIAVTPSPLSLGKRLCTLEDTCAYGSCFFIPGFIYLGSRAVVFIRSLSRSRPR